MSAAASSVFAVELLGELLRRGVTDAVVCPGSRSQALALAAAAAERAGAIRLHVRIDERSAAFFALGVARETGVPAPVIVTSGTAVANLAPAVLEAHEGRVPLLLLTADRPGELHGIRSNQTTRQAGLFGAVTRFSADVEAPELGADGDLRRDRDRDPGALALAALSAATGARAGQPPGPVHLNLAFREPLSGTQGFDRMIADGFSAAAAERDARGALDVPGSQHPASAYVHADSAPAVVIAGEGSGTAAAEFALAAGLPLLAEAVSGARVGAAIAHYAELLDEPGLGDRVERAIVFGHPSLTRQVPALLRRGGVEAIVVDPHEAADHYDPSREARVVSAARVAPGYDRSPSRAWHDAWHDADGRLRVLGEEGPGSADPLTREALAREVWAATGARDRLVLAASRLVRALDATVPPRAVRVHANRGLAGIDGTVATALGVAAASQRQPAEEEGVTRLLIGDLALLHDAGSLLLPAGEPHPRIQIVVGNDGGGTIFDGLEVAGTSDPEAYDRVMRTPQRVDIAQLAAAYGWIHYRAGTPAELRALLESSAPLPTIIEAPL